MKAIDKHLDEFEKNDLQLIWQTGKPFAQKGFASSAGRKNILCK